MHHLFQALEVAIVHVGLDETWRGAHIDIAQRGYLELRVELRREFNPLRIRIELAAIALQRAQKGSDSRIDVRRSGEIGTVAALVGLALVVELQSRISGDAEITGSKVRKQGFFPWPAVAMALVASRLAAEQVIAQFLLRRELVLSRLHGIVLRREGTHLWREFVCGNGQPEAVIGMVGPSSVCRAEMDRVQIIRGWRPRSRTDLFHVGRPLNGERVRPPHGLKKLAIGSVGK